MPLRTPNHAEPVVVASVTGGTSLIVLRFVRNSYTYVCAYAELAMSIAESTADAITTLLTNRDDVFIMEVRIVKSANGDKPSCLPLFTAIIPIQDVSAVKEKAAGYPAVFPKIFSYCMLVIFIFVKGWR